MRSKSTMSLQTNRENFWIVRIGSLSALLVLCGYIATFPVYAWVGNPPKTGVEAQLLYFGSHALGWWIITGLMIVTDLLLIPVFLALYQILQNLGKHLMLTALAMKFLFIALDLSVTWTAFSELIVAGGRYALASDVTKSTLIAGASYASAVLESPLSGIYAIVIPATGVLLVGLVMLRGVFGQFTAYLGILTGITGIAFLCAYFVEPLRILQYINALLATAWYGFVSVGLFKFCRKE